MEINMNLSLSNLGVSENAEMSNFSESKFDDCSMPRKRSSSKIIKIMSYYEANLDEDE